MASIARHIIPPSRRRRRSKSGWNSSTDGNLGYEEKEPGPGDAIPRNQQNGSPARGEEGEGSGKQMPSTSRGRRVSINEEPPSFKSAVSVIWSEETAAAGESTGSGVELTGPASGHTEGDGSGHLAGGRRSWFSESFNARTGKRGVHPGEGCDDPDGPRSFRESVSRSPSLKHILQRTPSMGNLIQGGRSVLATTANIFSSTTRSLLSADGDDEDACYIAAKHKGTLRQEEMRIKKDSMWEKSDEAAEARRNVEGSTLRSMLGKETYNKMHIGFEQGRECQAGGYEAPLIQPLPVWKCIKQGPMIMEVQGKYISAHMCITKTELCVARGADIRTMTDAIPLREIDQVQCTSKERWYVRTSDNGKNDGFTFGFKTLAGAKRHNTATSWMIELQIQIERLRQQDNHWLPKAQARVKKVYDRPETHMLISSIIWMNFVVVVCDTQYRSLIRESGEVIALRNRIFDNLDLAFTTFLTVELAVNAFAHQPREFLKNKWNLFDSLILLVSLLSIATTAVQGDNVFRSFRCFRALRLFGRLKTLRRIVGAVGKSIQPVSQAFLITAIVTAIYAVFGVRAFKDRAPQEFGDFAKSFYTLFKVVAFQDWNVQSLPVLKPPNYEVDVMVLVYILCLVLSTLWVLLNVVVAVLLDNYVMVMQREEMKDSVKRLIKAQRSNLQKCMGIDSMLHKMIPLFDTAEQLDLGLSRLFFVLDRNENGAVSYDELRVGLRKLNCEPRVDLKWADFVIMSDDMKWLNQNGEMSLFGFKIMMEMQLRLYIQRHMTDVLEIEKSYNRENQMVLKAIRALVVDLPFSHDLARLPARLSKLQERMLRLTRVVKWGGRPDKSKEEGQGWSVLVDGYSMVELHREMAGMLERAADTDIKDKFDECANAIPLNVTEEVLKREDKWAKMERKLHAMRCFMGQLITSVETHRAEALKAAQNVSEGINPVCLEPEAATLAAADAGEDAEVSSPAEEMAPSPFRSLKRFSLMKNPPFAQSKRAPVTVAAELGTMTMGEPVALPAAEASENADVSPRNTSPKSLRKRSSVSVGKDPANLERAASGSFKNLGLLLNTMSKPFVSTSGQSDPDSTNVSPGNTSPKTLRKRSSVQGSSKNLGVFLNTLSKSFVSTPGQFDPESTTVSPKQRGGACCECDANKRRKIENDEVVDELRKENHELRRVLAVANWQVKELLALLESTSNSSNHRKQNVPIDPCIDRCASGSQAATSAPPEEAKQNPDPEKLSAFLTEAAQIARLSSMGHLMASQDETERTWTRAASASSSSLSGTPNPAGASFSLSAQMGTAGELILLSPPEMAASFDTFAESRTDTGACVVLPSSDLDSPDVRFGSVATLTSLESADDPNSPDGRFGSMATLTSLETAEEGSSEAGPQPQSPVGSMSSATSQSSRRSQTLGRLSRASSTISSELASQSPDQSVASVAIMTTRHSPDINE